MYSRYMSNHTKPLSSLCTSHGPKAKGDQGTVVCTVVLMVDEGCPMSYLL